MVALCARGVGACQHGTGEAEVGGWWSPTFLGWGGSVTHLLRVDQAATHRHFKPSCHLLRPLAALWGHRGGVCHLGPG